MHRKLAPLVALAAALIALRLPPGRVGGGSTKPAAATRLAIWATE